MKKRLISVLCALVLVVACLLTALATRADAKSADAIRSDKETGVTVYQDTTGGIVLSNLPVPQRMMPGSVIIYDDQLQAKVIQGGYVKDGSTPILDTRTTIMRGLEAVRITADMSPGERATAEWENRLVNDFKTQILKNGIQATQLYSPTIYPGMKVVYSESDGYIDNVYYPDATEPSGYSIHNVPVNNSDSTTTMLAATPVLCQPYGAHSNVINFQYADDSFLGVGRATYFTGTTGNRGNTLRNYDCATQIDLDYSKVGDKNVTIRNLNTNQVFTFHQTDVGGLPDAVIDIWGLSNLQTLAGNPTPGVLSVCPVRYYHKRFSDQQVP